jgi:hypothetical protein
MCNVTTAGGEILNLDGPIESLEDAIKLANQIESEHNIEVKIVDLSNGTLKTLTQEVQC